MIIARFNAEKHYKDLGKLWEQHGGIPCPLDAIPRQSYVAKRNGDIIAFMGMYVDEGTIGVIDWAVANNNFSKEEKDEALQLLFNRLIVIAKLKKCNYIYSFTKNTKWGDKMKRYGMMLAESGACTYIMPIGKNKNTAFISD